MPPDADLGAAADSIAGFAVALEIVDVDDQQSMPQVITTDVFHRAVAFGPARSGRVAGPLTAQLSIGGHVASTQTVQLDPAQTVLTMAQLLAAVDHQVEAGEWIIGGSLIHLPISSGCDVTASLTGLGEVSIWIDP